MTGWIKCSEKLPQISFLESDNVNDFYGGISVLGRSIENCYCVVWLCKNQNEEDVWNYGELHWEAYIPGNGDIIELDFEEITHWMLLPYPPEKI